jgi:hypothetical protein
MYTLVILKLSNSEALSILSFETLPGNKKMNNSIDVIKIAGRNLKTRDNFFNLKFSRK